MYVCMCTNRATEWRVLGTERVSRVVQLRAPLYTCVGALHHTNTPVRRYQRNSHTTTEMLISSKLFCIAVAIILALLLLLSTTYYYYYY